MKRTYGWLLAGVVALALTLSLVGRAPHRRRELEEAPPVQAPVVEITLEIRSGTISPSALTVHKGDRIALVVTNSDQSRAEFALLGYEDRLSGIAIEPGCSWNGELIADRPGDDFAWVVNREVAGRLTVSGSHLVEGHR